MKKIKNNFKELKTNLKMCWYFVKEKLYFILLAILSLVLAGIGFILPLFSAQLLLKLTDGLLKDFYDTKDEIKYCWKCGNKLELKECFNCSVSEGTFPYCKNCEEFRFPFFNVAGSTIASK